MDFALCSSPDSWSVTDLVVLTAASWRATAAWMAVLSAAAWRRAACFCSRAVLASERNTPATTLSALFFARMSVPRLANSCPRPTWFR